MSKLASIAIITMFGGGAVACLVPSFEGMSGGTANASPGAADGGADPRDSGAAPEGGSSSTSTGAVDAGPRTFQCNPEMGSERCLLGSQGCCYNAGPSWKCVAENDSSTFCLGYSTCGDDSDCQAGETCCFNVNEGKCATGGCPGTGYRTCDRMKPHAATCGPNQTCTYPHSNYEPPRCF